MPKMFVHSQINTLWSISISYLLHHCKNSLQKNKSFRNFTK